MNQKAMLEAAELLNTQTRKEFARVCFENKIDSVKLTAALGFLAVISLNDESKSPMHIIQETMDIYSISSEFEDGFFPASDAEKIKGNEELGKAVLGYAESLMYLMKLRTDHL